MNAVEHIVECYFRYCKGCFTITDLKILHGNNRQCDLLAYNLATTEQFHVESSVTHQENWCPSTKDLQNLFDRKFRGIPGNHEGADYKKGKIYFDHINKTYSSIGFDPTKIKRVFVTWIITDIVNLKDFLTDYNNQNNIQIDVWSFRDQILPELMKRVSTSNYDDEVLRTLSLIRQHDLQSIPDKKN